ncbi:MAG: type IV secretion system protein [Gammaproteobacteria bacterium]|nr:type IV secretion system protein [Gammaproteobacteria bacterium]
MPAADGDGDLWLAMMTAMQGMDEKGKALASILPGDKSVLIGLAASTGLALAWLLIQTIFTDRGGLEAISKGVRAIAIGLLSLGALKSYPLLVNSFWDGAVWLTKKLTGGRDMFDLALTISKTALDAVTAGDIYSNKSGFDLLGALLHLADWLEAGLVAIFMAGLVALMGAMALWVGLIAKIAFWMGAALGPVLIAVAPLPLLQNYSLSWLKYMLTVSFYTVNASVALLLLEGIFQSVPGQMSQLVDPVSHLVRLPIALALLVVAGGGIIVMWQVPKLTDKMLGGGGGMSIK